MGKQPFSLYAMRLFSPRQDSKELHAEFETKDLLFRPTIVTDKYALDRKCFGNGVTMATYANRQPQSFQATENRCIAHEERRADDNPFHGFTIIEKKTGDISCATTCALIYRERNK